jgi:hypothetical protein
MRVRYRTCGPEHREEIIEFLLDKHGVICQFCKKILNINEPPVLQNGKQNQSYLSFDHIVPTCLGGANSIGNLRVLHVSCNSELGSLISRMLEGKTCKYQINFNKERRTK